MGEVSLWRPSPDRFTRVLRNALDEGIGTAWSARDETRLDDGSAVEVKDQAAQVLRDILTEVDIPEGCRLVLGRHLLDLGEGDVTPCRRPTAQKLHGEDTVDGLGVDRSRSPSGRSTRHTGWTVVDIGTHYGSYARLLSKLVGPAGSVLAFVANPETAAGLRRRVAKLRNVAVVNAALAEWTGQLELAQGFGGHSATWSIEPVAAGAATVTVPALTLDAALKGREVNLIKIDDEGGELRVLQGATSALKGRPVLPIEVHSHDLRRAVNDRLEPLGYRVTDLDGGHVLATAA